VVRPFYDHQAKARQGARNDLVNIVQQIAQPNHEAKSRDEAGKVANDLRPFYDEKAKARQALSGGDVRGKTVVQQIAQPNHEAKSRDEAGKVAGVNASASVT
jgi:hypothetical protein